MANHHVRQGSPMAITIDYVTQGDGGRVPWTAGTTATVRMDNATTGANVVNDQPMTAQDDGSGNLMLKYAGPTSDTATAGLLNMSVKVKIGGVGSPQEWPVGQPGQGFFTVLVEGTNP